MCCALCAQSPPSPHDSRFQIGTVDFNASIPNRAASNASGRCGDDTTTNTDDSVSCNSPIRCSKATRPMSDQFLRISSTMARHFGTTSSSYASYVSVRTSVRPSEWSRTVPENTTTAPQLGNNAQSYASPTCKGCSVSSIHVSPLWRFRRSVTESSYPRWATCLVKLT